ncbi:MAG: PAS domain-containing protein [Isosphaeraceae bacterium]|nr:PAS domain-containing protein [Isosphaeraceae bacterium]
MSGSSGPSSLRPGGTLLALALALALGFSLLGSPALLFLIGLALAVWYGGLRMGLAAVAALAALALARGHPPHPPKGWPLVNFVVVALLIVGLIEALRVAWRRAESDGIAKHDVEVRFLQLAENIQTAFWIYDLDGPKMTYISPAYEAIWGRTCESLYRDPMSFLEGIHPEDRERVLASLVRQRSGERMEEEYRVVRPDGSICWVHDRGFPIRDDAGRICRIAGIAEDITVRKLADLEHARLRASADEARQRAEQSEQRYRAFIANSSEGIWRFEGDEPVPITLPEDEQLERFYRFGYLAECNDAMARMYGFERAEQITGRRLADFLPPNDPRSEALLRAFIRSGYRLHDAEAHETDREGRPKIFLISFVGLVEDGLLLRAWGTQRDVTEQWQAEQALRESEERLRLALETGECGIWDWDLTTDRVTWSDRLFEFHGVDPVAFSGRGEDIQALIHPDDVGRISGVIQQAIADRTDFRVEFRAVRPDGAMRWLATSGRVLYDANGAPVRMLGATIDMTEPKAVEAELYAAKEAAEAASRAKDRFLAVLSHELRTPLTPALAATSALLEAPEMPPGLRPLLKLVRRNIDLEARLIDDLLDINRITLGKLRLNRERVDAHRHILQAVELCHAEIKAGGLHLELDLSAAEHHLEADPTRLQQVAWNLIKNAVKFTPSGGHLTIRTWNEEESEGEGSRRRLVLEVADTGIGIAPEALPKIFDAFEQGEALVSKRFGGLGLGLAISRSLAEAHGGRLRASSAGRGQGATFTLELPVVPAPIPGDDGGTPTPQEVPPPASLHLLLVEDNADILQVLARLLRRRGYRVTTAAGVGEALRGYPES